jgi:hypothetical protein|tara:strand:- start:2201 stop:2422 length:222 start_codon:yes stop_codon:yes gene_type:complete
MFVLLLTSCASVAIADQPEYGYGDWEELANRIQILESEGELIDVQPIVVPPDEVVEPEIPIEEKTPEEAIPSE